MTELHSWQRTQTDKVSQPFVHVLAQIFHFTHNQCSIVWVCGSGQWCVSFNSEDGSVYCSWPLTCFMKVCIKLHWTLLKRYICHWRQMWKIGYFHEWQILFYNLDALLDLNIDDRKEQIILTNYLVNAPSLYLIINWVLWPFFSLVLTYLFH